MIEVKALVKIFADGSNAGVKAVNQISFTVDEGRFYTLLGPSGCGKTTTLRCIAGLEKADEGEIIVAGAKVYSASRAHSLRPIGDPLYAGISKLRDLAPSHGVRKRRVSQGRQATLQQ